jgi:hypothetical protein
MTFALAILPSSWEVGPNCQLSRPSRVRDNVIRRPQHYLKGTRQTLGLSPSWALLLALLRRFGCQATTSGIPPPGASPPFARSSTCTQNFCWTTTARSSRLQTSPHGRQARAAALRPTPAHHHHRRPRAPRTPVLAPCSFCSLTASTRHTSGDRLPPRRLPAPRTSSPLRLAPSRRNGVSRSSLPHTGPNSRPCVRGTLARGSRSSANCTCPRSTKPRSRILLFVWK